MTQTLQLGGMPAPTPDAASVSSRGEVTIDGGPFELGCTDDDAWAYDNERPRHAVTLAPFRIDRAPVTNAEYAEFIAAGGYHDDALWSPEGRAWRDGEQADAPLYWMRDDGRWLRRRFDVVEPIPEYEPVSHVSFHEAEAFARWAGKRLPTEAEWEKAARTSDDLELMQGGVWQWTSSVLRPYPGFRAFPYPEYSEVFFGDDYRVLRGGAWPTDPLVARISFRNWDYPQRRQIFSGIRCARDV